MRTMVNEADDHGSTPLRRTVSDVSRSISSVQPPPESDGIDPERLKALHAARLRSALDFFRRKDEFNQNNKGSAVSRGCPGSIQANVTYSYKADETVEICPPWSTENSTNPAPNQHRILQRSFTAPNFNVSDLPSIVKQNHKTVTMNMVRSPGYGRLNIGTDSVQKPVSNVNGFIQTKSTLMDSKIEAEKEIATTEEFINGMPTLEKLKKEIDELDEKLHESTDYDVRRGMRAKIRDLRKQIKEEKYYKPASAIKTPVSQTNRISLRATPINIKDVQLSAAKNNITKNSVTTSVVPQTTRSTATVRLSRAPILTAQESPVFEQIPADNKDVCDKLQTSNITSQNEHSNSCTINARNSLHTVEESIEELHKDTDICPDIIRPLVNQSVIDGETCSMQCRVSSPEGGATVTWYHEEQVIESVPEFRQSFSGGLAKLDISNVLLKHAGVYKCVVKSADGMAETVASLTVLGGNEAAIPEITEPLQDVVGNEGDTVTLQCLVCGRPQPSITWSRDGYPLHGANRHIYSYDGIEATLTIKDSITGDGGVYTCEAKNSEGMASSDCNLDIKAADFKRPEFLTVLVSTHRVKESEQVTLSCHVTGKPRPEVTWYHGETILVDSPNHSMQYQRDCAKLTLKKCSRHMAGRYSCVAQNSAGEMSTITDLIITERGPPEFTTPPSDTVSAAGSTVSLICRILANPKPVVLWQKDKEFIRSGPQYRQMFDGDIATLDIIDVGVNDRGQYTCVARNDHGRVKASCHLAVTGPGIPDEVLHKMSAKADINKINDEDELYKILNATEDFEERKKIRSRMRDIRESKAAEFERQKKERENQEDALSLRLRRAEEQKQKKLTEYDEQAKLGRQDIGTVEQAIREKHAKADAEKQKKIESYTEMGKAMSQVYGAGSEILRKAEDDQQRRLKELSEEGVSRSTKTEKHTDGGTTTTSTTVTTHKTKDGSTTTVKQTKQVTQTSGIGGTTYNISKTSAASKPSGPGGARAAFQQMDKTNTPSGGARPTFLGGAGGSAPGRPVQRSPSTIKQMLLDWCKAMTKEYEPTVQITNFSSSWNNGMAFCALIHHFYPDAFNFEELDPKKRRYNFTLAFETAEKLGDVAPLLDVEDMVRMKNPDWKCVFTYVQMFYRRFREQSGSTPTTPVTPISPEPVSAN